jgi:hypothetical protein
MPMSQQAAVVSLALSLGVAAVAVLLGWRQWQERRRREPELTPADSRHFARQDLRRGLGVLVLALLAVGLAAGSRVEPRVAARTNPLFIPLWLGILGLSFVLLVLALLDWLATRLYARRHVRAIARERLAILRDELRRRAAPRMPRDDWREAVDDPPPP